MLLACHHAITWAFIGLIWIIQVAHYPLFAHVTRESFPACHRRHLQRLTWIAGPLMLGEAVTAAWLVLAGPRDPWLLASLPALGAAWLSTCFVQAPLRDKLAAGFVEQVHARLVSTNWWRVAAWTSRGLRLLPGRL